MKNSHIQKLQKKAQAGDPYAQYELAMQYIEGTEIEEDIYMAMFWLGKSARQGYESAIQSRLTIRMNIAQSCGESKPQKTSAKYQKEITAFKTQIAQGIKLFVEECEERYNWEPESFSWFNVENNTGHTIYMGILPYPASIKDNGFKEYLMAEVLQFKIESLLHSDCPKRAHAYLEAFDGVLQTINEPWMLHKKLDYYQAKGEVYRTQKAWDKAITAYWNAILMMEIGYITELNKKGNIYEEMDEEEREEYQYIELHYYPSCLNLIQCLIISNQREEAERVASCLQDLIDLQIQRSESYIVYQWLYKAFIAEEQQEPNLICTLKELGNNLLMAYCRPLLVMIEEEAKAENSANFFHWSRLIYELVEKMFASIIPYLETQTHETEEALHMHIYQSIYFMQTRRFTLAEKELEIAIAHEEQHSDANRKNSMNNWLRIATQYCDLYEKQGCTEKIQEKLLFILGHFKGNERRTKIYKQIKKMSER